MQYSIFKQELGQMIAIIKSRLKTAFIVGALSFCISASWAIASPPGSSPDEDAHLTTAWCMSKYGIGDCLKVPLRVVESGKCFFLDADNLPTCEDGLKKTEISPERVMNQNVYYKVLGYFVTQSDIDLSIIKMRMFNAFISSIVLMIVILLSTKNVSYATIMGWLIVNVPLGFFITSSINSSSWPYIFASALFPLLLNIFKRDLWSIPVLFKILFIMILFYISSQVRVDVLLFLSVYLVTFIPMLFSSDFNEKKTFRFLKNKQILSGVSIISSIFLLKEIWNRSRQVEFRDYDISEWENFTRLPSIITGIFGSWGLGSLEVRMPSITFVLAISVVLSIIYLSFKYANYSEIQALVNLIIFAFAIPFFVLVRSNLRVGEWVQPRYILPIFYGILMLSLLIIIRNINRKKINTLIVTSVLITLAYAFAFYTTLRRYTIGLSTYDFNLVNESSWWWSFEYIPSPLFVFLISVTSYFMLFAYITNLVYKELPKEIQYISK
jgi:hypothetical protein